MAMNKSLPPLGWFRAFESAARHLNFTHAADELNLTQSAVSQHIRSLESRLGCPLFIRQHRKLVLTDEGRRLLPTVRKSITQLKEATQAFDGTSGREVITVSASASILQWYIVPGLQEFMREHPSHDVRIISKIWPDEFSIGAADVEIRFDTPESSEKRSKLLFPDSMVLVSSPGTVGKLEDHPLIGVAGTNDTWEKWFHGTGHPSVPAVNCTVESHGMAVDCARAGVGIALTSFTISAPALADGSLVLFDRNFLPATDGYYLSFNKGEPEKPAVSEFIEWLRDRIDSIKANVLKSAC